MSLLHHHLIKTNLENIYPTQTSVGYAEVKNKRAEWESLDKKQRKTLVNAHWFPAIIGPKGNYYLVDHHHLGFALLEEGHKEVYLTILKDLSMVSDIQTFWRVMEFSQWVYPYDNQGKRIDFNSLPKKIEDLSDDPYRSLAGLARNAGAYAKSDTPFTEFMWADYFRPLIKKKVIQNSLEQALDQAVEYARKSEASYLPGWHGKHL